MVAMMSLVLHQIHPVKPGAPNAKGNSLQLQTVTLRSLQCLWAFWSLGLEWSQLRLWLPGLVNIQKAMERKSPFFMGKSTISTGPFSIAMLVHQRV